MKILLVLVVFLTIVAWRHGWKWKALLPVGICVGIGFLIGLGVGSSSGSVSDMGWVVILDIIAIIVLIVMCIKKPASRSVTWPSE